VKKIELEILEDFHVSTTAQNEELVLESCRSLCLHVYVYECMYLRMDMSLDNARTLETTLFTFGI
jgi:hypothetical protein